MASHFFLRGQEKVTKKKATPTIPNSRSLNLPARGAEIRLALFDIYVSEPQTSAPLIRRQTQISAGLEGGSQNRGGDDETCCGYYSGSHMRQFFMRYYHVLILIIALGALSTPQPASAFNVVMDESTFLLGYESPTEVIMLDNPSPASFYGVSYLLDDGSVAYEIREEGWSPSVNIGSLRNGGECCWGATTWFGTYVSPSIYDRPLNWIDRIYISLVGFASVLSLKTSNGFYGLVPTSSSDIFFTLPVNVTLTEVALGYRQVSSVPEPTSVVLLGVGLGVIFLRCATQTRLGGRRTWI